MVFNSFDFIVFFPVATVLYFLTPSRWRWAFIFAASVFVYMSFVPKYILLLLSVCGFNFFSGLVIEAAAGTKRQKFFVNAAVAANVLLLAFFKYYYFFLAPANVMVGAISLHKFSLPLVMLFPVGLSFQTFQAISYLLEIKRGTIKAERHFGIFAAYILFFPKLIAGPIERPQNLLPQFRQKKEFDAGRILAGLKTMLWGYLKKLVIADRVAMFITEVYNEPEYAGSLNIWLAVLLYPVQLYCDFSGYSSIAIGAAKVLGYDLMENFRRPYVALTLTELWSRWHISLSTWLRDYIYQPLVVFGRDYGNAAIVFALLATFIISGIWHGTGLTFLLWGLMQGLIMVVEFLTGVKSFRLAKTKGGRIRGVLTTYLLWSLSLIFFKAASLKQAGVIFQKSFLSVDWRFTPSASPLLSFVLVFASVSLLFYFEAKNYELRLLQPRPWKKELALGSAMLVTLLTLGVYHNLSFIYFKF